MPDTANYLYDGDDLLEEIDNSGNVLARYTHGRIAHSNSGWGWPSFAFFAKLTNSGREIRGKFEDGKFGDRRNIPQF